MNGYSASLGTLSVIKVISKELRLIRQAYLGAKFSNQTTGNASTAPFVAGNLPWHLVC
jgi:hypothetical protein